MIILPNYFDRYLSCLRYYVSLSILKHGLSIKHLKNLQKIYIAEAIFYKNTKDNINIEKFTSNLLKAISDVTRNFEFSSEIKGNYMINKNLLELLIILIAKQTEFLQIKSLDNYLTVKFIGKPKNLKPIIYALDGVFLFEMKKNKSIIIIPLRETVYHDETASEYQHIFDKFSFFNVFFERII